MSDGWRVRIKPDAVRIMKIKRAVLDFMVKPLHKDLPVSPWSHGARHSCSQNPLCLTMYYCSDIVWAMYDGIIWPAYAIAPICMCRLVLQGLPPYGELRFEASAIMNAVLPLLSVGLSVSEPADIYTCCICRLQLG